MNEKKIFPSEQLRHLSGESLFWRWGPLWAVMIVCLVIMPSVAMAEGPILSASEDDYPPFCIVDPEGQANGFSVELLNAAAAAMGRTVTFRVGPWAEIKGWLEQGKVQALPLVGRTPERESIFDFTFPYMSLHGAIVVRTGTKHIRDLEDLSGKQVVVMKGDNAEEFLWREDRGFEIHTTSTFEEALRQLSEGRYDAVVMQRLVALRLIRETGLKNLQVLDKPIDGFRQDFCFAVKEGDRDTLSLLNEGLALVMADGTYRHLHAKWFAALELPSHRRIVVGGDHNYPPFEYLDENGRPAGYNVELTRAIAQEVGLELEIRLGPWAEIREALAHGEIDALQGMFYSAERDLTFDFTPPHTVNHCVSVVRKGGGPPPTTVADLAGMRIVVQQGDIMHDFVLENGLSAQVSTVEAQEDALRQLAEGKYDCALVARMTAMYWIKKYGWDNLTVGNRPFLSPGYCYAVPQNQKALLAQLSEGLKVLDETGEYRRIYEKWMGVYEDSPPKFATIFRYVAMVATPLLLLILASFLWLWSLRKQVAYRTKELLQSEAFQRAIIACSPLPMLSVDLEGQVLTWNASAENVFGWKAEEIVGKPLPIVPPDKKEEFDGLRKRIILGRGFSGMEVMRQKKDGERLHVSLSAAPVHDAGGKVIGIMASIEDISERKRAEEALRESEKRFRLLVESSPDAIFVQTDGRFSYMNTSAVRLFGAHAAEELLGERVLDRLHPDFRERVQERIRLLNEERGFVPRMEEIYLRLDGTPVPVEVSAVPFHYEGKAGALVFVRDISERRRGEQEREKLQGQLTQAQKMESVGRLAGGVAHDFNNMLSVILGHTEMALEQLDPAQPLFADMQEIRKAAKRSADLTRQLLAFARKQTVAPKVLDLNETVEGMLKMLRRLIGEDIDLAWLPETGLWPVKMDPAQIDQILANLCVNARDAIVGVGKVTIETQNVTFDEDYCAGHEGLISGRYVMLAVSDDGSGMGKETLDRLFEPFFTTKETGKGTGLGLATVYGIVKQNDGYINVYSELQKGTSFKIYLPQYAINAEERMEEGRPALAAKGKETILLAEDEPAILGLTRIMLERLGYNVLAGSTPGEAIRLAKEQVGEIHLLMTDVVMPEMNGRDLAKILISFYPRMKCLYMSGYTANVIAHHGVLDEGVHFIQKPISMHDLAAKVRDVLDS